MPQPKIYAAVLNHFGSLSDLSDTPEAAKKADQ